MDSNNWRPTQGGEPPMDTADWRTQLQADSRHRIVNKIMETLKRHLPFPGQEGLQELMNIAVRFEEKIYTSATSQSDYLRTISLKMLTMENKSNPMLNAIQSNSAVNSKNSPDRGMTKKKSMTASERQKKDMDVVVRNVRDMISNARNNLIATPSSTTTVPAKNKTPAKKKAPAKEKGPVKKKAKK